MFRNYPTCDTGTMFPVEIWGTVGQWVGSITSSGALLLALLLLLRDRKKEERAQAQAITCWYELHGPKAGTDGLPRYPGYIHVVNHSVRPVYNLSGSVTLVSAGEYERRRANVPANGRPGYSRAEWKNPSGSLSAFAKSGLRCEGDSRVLKPDATLTFVYAAPVSKRYFDILVRFTDNDGFEWSRNVDTKSLRRRDRQDVVYYGESLVPQRLTISDRVRKFRDRRFG